MRSFNIITGDKGGGKTTMMLFLSSLLSSPVGFVCLHRAEGYYMKNLESGEERLLMTHLPVFSSVWREWYYDESLFDCVYETLKNVTAGNVFLDECGRMEIEGMGYSRTLQALLKSDADIYITLRTPFIRDFVTSFSIEDCSVYTISDRADRDKLLNRFSQAPVGD